MALSLSGGYPAASVRSHSAGAITGVGGRGPPRAPVEIEQLTSVLDQRVTHVSQAEDARLRMLADQTQRLMEGLQAMRVSREIHEERRLKEQQMIESNVLLDLESMRQARKEFEARAEEACTAKLGASREDVQRELMQHGVVYQEYTKQISEEVRKVQQLVEEQRSSRAEYGERIVASLEVEFRKVSDAIVAEQKLRFEAEGTMLRMVEDVCSRMRAEIQTERQEREGVQGKLLGLLEGTCNRIEATFSRGGQVDLCRNSQKEQLMI